jgi:hypothetical protein
MRLTANARGAFVRSTRHRKMSREMSSNLLGNFFLLSSCVLCLNCSEKPNDAVETNKKAYSTEEIKAAKAQIKIFEEIDRNRIEATDSADPGPVDENDLVGLLYQEALETARNEGDSGSSCETAIGKELSGRLVSQCNQVSGATRPPCNAANSCDMIVEEIDRSCAAEFFDDFPNVCKGSVP